MALNPSFLTGPSSAAAPMMATADIAKAALATGGGILGSSSRSDGALNPNNVFSSAFIIGDNAAVGDAPAASQAIGNGVSNVLEAIQTPLTIALALAAGLLVIKAVKK